jgi:hypothetical protein
MTSGGSPCVSQASHLLEISAFAAGDSPPAYSVGRGAATGFGSSTVSSSA